MMDCFLFSALTTRRVFAFVVSLSLLAPLFVTAKTAPVTYQGHLTQEGEPLDGKVSLSFTLFDSETDGQEVAGPVSVSTTVTNGLFSTVLHFPSGIFDGSPLWIEITVNDGKQILRLEPRQPLTPVPMAHFALTPAGPAGPEGPQGPIGPEGPAGDSAFTMEDGDLTYSVNNQGMALYLNENSNFAPRIVFGHGANEATLTGAAVLGGGGVNDPNRATGEYAVIAGGQGNIAAGFHSSISGGRNNTTSGNESTIGGGEDNVIEVGGVRATIGGGDENTAIGTRSTIGGGRENLASGSYSTVGGGIDNVSSGSLSIVGGGMLNRATGTRATVSGGYNNQAVGTGSQSAATVGGGQDNRAEGSGSIVAGGTNNTADGNRATVAGGWGNTASNNLASIGGGRDNIASGTRATVAGGGFNWATGFRSAILGGTDNKAANDYAVVGGGLNNNASGIYSTVLGGRDNTAAGSYSFAGGREALANHTGSFVWGGSFTTPFASTGTNQFLVNSRMGVGTNATLGQLHVEAPTGRPNVVMDKTNNVTTWALDGGFNLSFLKTTHGSSNFDEMAFVDHIDGRYTRVSDRRFKTNIEYLDGVLPQVLDLRAATYAMKETSEADHRSIGFIAQEVQETFPSLVSEMASGSLGLNYDQFSILAIQAIREQQEIIEEQNDAIEHLLERVADLENRAAATTASSNDALKNRLATLEALMEVSSAGGVRYE